MKKFRDLLIAGISEDIHGTTVERLVKVKKTFESEMIYNSIKPSMELLTEWLKGLPLAIHVPYMNDDIVEWYEKQLGRKAKPQKSNKGISEAENWVNITYWPQCGRTLYEMLYK